MVFCKLDLAGKREMLFKRRKCLLLVDSWLYNIWWLITSQDAVFLLFFLFKQNSCINKIVFSSHICLKRIHVSLKLAVNTHLIFKDCHLLQKEIFISQTGKNYVIERRSVFLIYCLSRYAKKKKGKIRFV